MKTYYFENENDTGRVGFIIAKDTQSALKLLKYHLEKEDLSDCKFYEQNVVPVKYGMIGSFIPQVDGTNEWDVM